jgi:hypothetical protein
MVGEFRREKRRSSIRPDFRLWQILLQKSKIEQPKKSRESRSQGISAAASLASATAEARGRFWMRRYGPSRRRAQTHQRLKEFSFDTPKDFCNNIGT